MKEIIRPTYVGSDGAVRLRYPVIRNMKNQNININLHMKGGTHLHDFLHIYGRTHLQDFGILAP